MKGCLAIAGILSAVIFVLVAVSLGLTGYGYSKLQTDFDAQDYSVAFNSGVDWPDLGIGIITADLSKVMGAFVEGLSIKGELRYQNTFFIPLYVPKMEHTVFINGIECTEIVTTKGGWIPGSSNTSESFDLIIGLDDLPLVALDTLIQGGDITVDIQSLIKLGPFSYTKESYEVKSLLNPYSSYEITAIPPTQTPTTPAIQPCRVIDYSFSPNTIECNQSSTCNISIYEGYSGNYTLQIWKDLSAWPDELVKTYEIAHDGSTTSKSFSFTPTVTGSYHMDIVYNGSTIWSQPNDASRLTVNPSATPFSIVNYGFSPDPITLGDSTSASITISGGDAGNYTVRLWRDIDLLPDEQVGSFSFYHDGSTTTGAQSFTPGQVGSYHMDLQFGGGELFDQPNDASRLTVNPSATPFFISAYSFLPKTISLGQMTQAKITIIGGSIGTYTVQIWRDITLLPDELVKAYTISHNGSSTSKSFSFTPTMAGKYHIAIVYNGNTLWSQPNDASRLVVSN